MKKEILTEEAREALYQDLLQELAAKIMNLGPGESASIPIDTVAKALGVSPEELREVMEKDPGTGYVH